MHASWNEFITWEKSTRDTIDVKKTYIDISDDFMAGVLLSQIVYWYLPNKEGRSKLRVKKDGHYWIAKKREEWFDEIRFSESNYKTAIKKLEKQNLVVKERFKFDGAPTTHIRLNIKEFLQKLNDLMRKHEENLDSDMADFNEYLELELKPDTYSHMDSVKSTESIRRNPPNGNGGIHRMETAKSAESLTETTTKTTNKDYLTEITKSSSSYIEQPKSKKWTAEKKQKDDEEDKTNPISKKGNLSRKKQPSAKKSTTANLETLKQMNSEFALISAYLRRNNVFNDKEISEVLQYLVDNNEQVEGVSKKDLDDTKKKLFINIDSISVPTSWFARCLVNVIMNNRIDSDLSAEILRKNQNRMNGQVSSVYYDWTQDESENVGN